MPTMNTKDFDMAIQTVVERLKRLPVSRIILFGSSANGATTSDSDVDLAIVMDRPTAFENYDQRLEAKSEIRKSILDINGKIPIDILLYTESEYNELRQFKGFLSTEILARGRTLYEKAG